MNINPTDFAFYLKSSSLSSQEQAVVLALLPDLSGAEVEQLYHRLQADHRALGRALRQAHAKRAGLEQHLSQVLKV